MSKSVTRLFNQFRPESYDLFIDVHESKASFSGKVTIRGQKVGRPSKRLTFHQKGLKVTTASLTYKGKAGAKTIEVSRINKQAKYDEVRLHGQDMLYPGHYEVSLEFSGHITAPMHGIYPCPFKHDGQDKKLIATQFESHNAREAFPCIDEPEAKAVFNLTIVGPDSETVLSNTPIKKQSTKAGRQQTAFEPTPIMSPYLLAFVMGELVNLSGQTKDGIKVSSWATVAQPVDQLKFANSEAIKALEFFIDYFKTSFPLKKIDQVALPDFEAAAMENWGLITFREVTLLTDSNNRSISTEQFINKVISHEMSHQWFGNLVTMKWWDDLWLNESFASIMEIVAPAELHPDWHQWEEFASGLVLSCSNRDIYKDVQPVGVEVKHPDDIATLFDPQIVYAKGARLLNMLREYIGDKAFRQGLHSYFDKHAYSNTTRHDLWQALAKTGHANIDKFMTPWITQSGQPLLRVASSPGKLRLQQSRFLLDGEDKTSLWPIPLLASTKLPIDILDKPSVELEFNGPEVPIFNVNGNGHYIVKYEDQAAIDSLVDKFKDRSISSISRITMLNDMLLLARAGEYSLITLLDIVKHCQKEDRDAVWSMFLRIVGQAQTLTDGDKSTEQDIKLFKRQLSAHWYEKLGWQDKPKDDTNTKHLRTTALALNLSGENPDALKTALKMFKTAGKVENLPAELRSMIAGTAVRHGDNSVVEQLMKEYVSPTSPDTLQAITAALCTTKDPKVGAKLIKWGLDEGGIVRMQDMDHWYAYLMRNHYTRDLAWDWMTNSWDRLVGMFRSHMEFFIWYSSGPLSTPEWQAKFKKFFEPKLSGAASKRNILIGFSEIEARVAWRGREEASLKQYFKS